MKILLGEEISFHLNAGIEPKTRSQQVFSRFVMYYSFYHLKLNLSKLRTMSVNEAAYIDKLPCCEVLVKPSDTITEE